MRQVAGVVLAAGASTRLGRLKQLLDWGGVPLLVHTTDKALAAGLEPVIVVLGCQAEAVQAVLGARSVQVVMNWRWEEGLSTSVQAGLAALPPGVEAAILMPCDQPLLTAALLREMVDRFEETGAAIVYPQHAGRRGTPTLFARSLFPELAAVSGDEGGRGVIARHLDAATALEVLDADVLADLDTPADAQRLREKAARFEPGTILSPIRHLIVDMDGVLWRGDDPLPGLERFFAFLRERRIGFILATNNSSKTPEQYVEKLARFGVQVPVGSILTSAQVAAAYLATVAAPGTRVYMIGDEGVRQALEECGFVLSEEEAEYVVVGWDRRLTWEKLATAALLIHRGAGFVGTNPDTNYPTERGPVPGNGAQLAALQTTTGVAPVVTGKPEPWMVEEALRRLDATPQTTAVIGDRLDTDIAGGARLGLRTVLVLSGITRAEELAGSSVRPDVVCVDIEELTRLWQAALGS